jgi:hypothetical protein
MSKSELTLSRVAYVAVQLKFNSDHNVRIRTTRDALEGNTNPLYDHHGIQTVEILPEAEEMQDQVKITFIDDTHLAWFKMEFTSEINQIDMWQTMANNMVGIQPMSEPTGKIFTLHKNRFNEEK